MTTMASQITSLIDAYSIVYSDADRRKHQSSASLAFVWGIHRDRWISRAKGQLRGICFHLMTSSWHTKWSADLMPNKAYFRGTMSWHKNALGVLWNWNSPITVVLAWTKCSANNEVTGNFRRQGAHVNVTVMVSESNQARRFDYSRFLNLTISFIHHPDIIITEDKTMFLEDKTLQLTLQGEQTLHFQRFV